MSKKIAAVTVIKSNSVRLPGKNIRPLNGKPLYLYTAEFGASLGIKYYLIHDYEHGIIEIPKGCTEVKVSKEDAGDRINQIEKIKKYIPSQDVYILLQATSPFRDLETVKTEIEDFPNSVYDTVIAMQRAEAGYYYSLDKNRINFIQNERDCDGCRKEPLYRETGSLFIFRQKQLFKRHICNTDKLGFYIDRYGIDIDNESDFIKAEEIARLQEI